MVEMVYLFTLYQYKKALVANKHVELKLCFPESIYTNKHKKCNAKNNNFCWCKFWLIEKLDSPAL